MKKVNELLLGFGDAENYRRRENKQMLNDIFIKDDNLERLLALGTYFLMGDKGTGKTAYAVFLSNNEYKETRSCLKYIRETEYQKFVALKREKHLVLSDYVNIWKVILLVLVATSIENEEIKENIFSKFDKIESILSAIEEYYKNAFSPEIVNVLKIVDDSKMAAELMYKYLKIGGSEKKSVSFEESRFQINLQYIETRISDALEDLRIKNNHFVFIDGIDVRPDGIDYEEYLLCVKGLVNAVWNLNNDFFSNIRGSTGRFKIVLLIRPDIFQSIGMQNATNKIRDNSVFLDWRTTYPEHRTSKLFALSDKLLTHQQDKTLGIMSSWDSYFPWDSPSTSPSRDSDSAFIDFLRLSYSRPRDIITILNILQDLIKKDNKNALIFEKKYFQSDAFKNAYSEYLMGGIKDQLAFYYSQYDYELLLHFLSLFRGKAEFDYAYYSKQYEIFSEYILQKANELPQFVDNKEMFLQFLYDANIICYFEQGPREPLFSWCYRERSMSNISPKVQYDAKYRFHYGLLKNLRLGSY